jgi:hypothetical protein
MQYETKQERGERLFPGLTFDCALPQDWLNQFPGDQYDTVRSGTIWAYPQGSIFGIPVPITEQAADTIHAIDPFWIEHWEQLSARYESRSCPQCHHPKSKLLPMSDGYRTCTECGFHQGSDHE